MLSLQAQGVSFSYTDRAVLQGITFTIQAGQKFALVGPNGAGKSTLLRLLALLEIPSQGQVVISENTHRLPGDTATRRRIVMVLQRPFLFQMSVFENVLYGLQLRGMDHQRAKERVEHALEITGLVERASQPARTLSGGEAQLVNIARAIAVQPDVLLLDEVTAHLDLVNEARVEEILQRFCQETGATLVLVTQNLPQAQRIAEHGAMLYEGELVEQGRVADFLQHPTDERAKRFITGQTLIKDEG